jgi:DNA/RNA endonuclease G (NUC1)
MLLPTTGGCGTLLGWVPFFGTQSDRLYVYKTAEHLNKASLTPSGGSSDSGDRSKSTFVEDESLPAQFRAKLQDYFRSGYDRGHMCVPGLLWSYILTEVRVRVPAADAKSSQDAMNETFLLSNIAPQVGDGFNRHCTLDTIGPRRVLTFPQTGHTLRIGAAS